MDYTIDDLRGKWVKAGTPEAEVFLDACDNLGVLWLSGSKPKNYTLTIGSKIFVNSEDKLSGECCNEFKKVTPFIPKPQWSIYTNDKPLSELSDEQAAALFNAWRGNSEQLEGWDDTEWFGLGSSHHIIKNGIYRIKQKSECELFVEKCVKSIKSHNSDDPAYYSEWFEQLFNTGCRFTEDNNK